MWRSPRTSSSSTQIRRRVGRVHLAQLRWAEWTPERRVHLRLGGRVGSGSRLATYSGEPVARSSAVPKLSGVGGDHLDGNPLDGDADGAVVLPLEHGDDLRQPLELE